MTGSERLTFFYRINCAQGSLTSFFKNLCAVAVQYYMLRLYNLVTHDL